MSRVAKKIIEIPAGVTIDIKGQKVAVKGKKGALNYTVHEAVQVKAIDNTVQVSTTSDSRKDIALAGTMRALLNNMVQGVHEGFEKRLRLVGVGYRAQVQGNTLNLSLGFSHPVEFAVPEGVQIQTPSQTDIVVSGTDKQQVGQVAANIRAYRPPEPYKGKGVRYGDEQVIMKEAKKK